MANLYEVEREGESCWERIQVTDSGGPGPPKRRPNSLPRALPISPSPFQGIRLAQPGEYLITVECAAKESGPWELVRRRKVRAILGSHPLAREGQGSEAKVPAGTAALTD